MEDIKTPVLSTEDALRVKELIESEDSLDNKIGVGLALEKGMSIEQLAAWALSSLLRNLDKESVEYKYVTSNKERCYQDAIDNIKKMLN